MGEKRFIELLVELHKGLARLGPGNAQSTLKALSMCEHLPDAPDILDIGCGAGAQTLVLASATSGHIIATDLIPQFIDQLHNSIQHERLRERVSICEADMKHLPFPDGSFDLVWSEGAAYIMGFDNALTQWKRLLRPGGYLAVSEACWFKANPPAELKTFWDENYPAIRGVDDNLIVARKLGWETVANFDLPTEAWTAEYYGPLKKRLPDFRNANISDNGAQQVADMTEYEIILMEKFSEYCGYEFYILRSMGEAR